MLVSCSKQRSSFLSYSMFEKRLYFFPCFEKSLFFILVLCFWYHIWRSTWRSRKSWKGQPATCSSLKKIRLKYLPYSGTALIYFQMYPPDIICILSICKGKVSWDLCFGFFSSMSLHFNKYLVPLCHSFLFCFPDWYWYEYISTGGNFA